MGATYPFIRSLEAPREYNVTAGTVITPGDLLWWNGTTLKSVGGSANLVEAWSSEAQARRNARARFVGIAEFQANSDDHFDHTYAVRPTGIIEMACTSCTPHAGDLFGFEKDTGGNYLYSQQLQLVTHPYDAIGYCVKDYAAATTTVQIAFFSGHLMHDHLSALVKLTPAFYVSATLFAAGGDYFRSFAPGERIRVLGAYAHASVLTAGAATVTFTTSTGAMDNTLTIPDATALGTVVYGALAPGAVNPLNDYCEHDDVLKATGDATPTAGAIDIAVEYMTMPLAA